MAKRASRSVEKKQVDMGSLAEPSEFMFALFGASETYSKKSVTPNTAMRCPAVACAVGQIAGAIGTLPCFVFERSDDDGRRRAKDHPAYRIVHDDANEFTSAPRFREQLVVDALLHGNGIGLIGRVDGGRPFEAIRLKPESVAITEDERTGDPIYTLSGKAGQRVLDRRDVIHVPALSIDGVKGVAPIRLAREAIGLALTLEEHCARLFSQGVFASGILTPNAKLSEESIKKVRAAFEKSNAGTQNAGRVLIMPVPFEYKFTAFSSVDAQLAEMRAVQMVEIARAFQIPPIFLEDYGRATWSNSEAMARLFLQYCLSPWLERIEAAFRHALIAPDDRDRYYIEFSTDELLKSDLPARAEAYGKLIAARVLNPNEARAAENRPPYEGGDLYGRRILPARRGHGGRRVDAHSPALARPVGEKIDPRARLAA